MADLSLWIPPYTHLNSLHAHVDGEYISWSLHAPGGADHGLVRILSVRRPVVSLSFAWLNGLSLKALVTCGLLSISPAL